jgi:small subunit ribosomal protein S3
MKLPLALLALAALAACSRQAEQNVAEQFDQTQNAIENTAAALEAETANATRAATDALENQAAEVSNRADAIEKAATTNSQAANSAK